MYIFYSETCLLCIKVFSFVQGFGASYSLYTYLKASQVPFALRYFLAYRNKEVVKHFIFIIVRQQVFS